MEENEVLLGRVRAEKAFIMVELSAASLRQRSIATSKSSQFLLTYKAEKL